MDRDTLARVLDKIQVQSQRCVNIVEHTRDVVRDTQLHKERVDIAELLQEVLALLELNLQQRAVTMHLDIAEDLPEFSLCRSAIQQVLINLALNSLNALGQTPTANALIRIQAWQDHDRGSLSLRVSDNGPGIPIALRAKLFDSFSRPSHEGLGLGLAICRRLVDAHQGEIVLEETLQGSSIVLRIPQTTSYP